MGELGALFNPGMRHELQERQEKAARREEEGNARDGDLRIDLESGVAVINIPGADDEQPVASDSAGVAEPSADDSATSPTAKNTVAPDTADTAAGEASASDAAATDTAAVDTAATDTAGVEANPEPQPVLRPRGKRGMSASHR